MYTRIVVFREYQVGRKNPYLDELDLPADSTKMAGESFTPEEEQEAMQSGLPRNAVG